MPRPNPSTAYFFTTVSSLLTPHTTNFTSPNLNPPHSTSSHPTPDSTATRPTPHHTTHSTPLHSTPPYPIHSTHSSTLHCYSPYQSHSTHSTLTHFPTPLDPFHPTPLEPTLPHPTPTTPPTPPHPDFYPSRESGVIAPVSYDASTASPLRVSDHRPVFATFHAHVSSVY